MVMTILESVVEVQFWSTLQKAYLELTKTVPTFIKNSYLAQDQKNNSVWRIITIWESQEALDAMRNSGETPTGVLIFQKASAKPTLSIFDVRKSKAE